MGSIKRIITQNLIVEFRNVTAFKLLKMLKYLQKKGYTTLNALLY